MLKIACIACFLIVFISHGYPQSQPAGLQRPKLVVGIMIDQMRWDYLYRFWDRYGNNGFKRMINEGFTCDNTLIPYPQTVTAVGHATVYTGSVPAIHGMMGNEWFDKSADRIVYCVEDNRFQSVGTTTKLVSGSPQNLWTTTLGDEFRLATNFRSKVVGIAIKDRSAIIPAGHSNNGAYWYDASAGNWITSTYYMPQLPAWVQNFNNRKLADSFYNFNWNTLYPVNTYLQSDTDTAFYEGKFAHETGSMFPHELKSQAGKNYSVLPATPFGNTFTLEFAKAALKAENLGKDAITDLLAISLSSPDYIGHRFGPNSIEIEDTFLRLDKDLADFFAFLDAETGRDQYLVFLTADHGVAHTPAYLNRNRIPSLSLSSIVTSISTLVEKQFGIKEVIKHSSNYQLYLNNNAINNRRHSEDEIKRFIVRQLNSDPNVLVAFDNHSINNANLPKEMKEFFLNGHNARLAGDIQIVMKPSVFFGGQAGTTHGSWYRYDSHLPLLWYGWKVKQGKTNREVYTKDIAPTISAMLQIQEPNGNVGKVIEELIK